MARFRVRRPGGQQAVNNECGADWQGPPRGQAPFRGPVFCRNLPPPCADSAADGHGGSATSTLALEIVGSVGKKNTGTRLRFWPDPKYFDTPKFNVRALRHLLRAKAVLCPGLTVSLFDEASGRRVSD